MSFAWPDKERWRQAPTTYRPEIDGLRAVAVLPVILFHAGFSTFKGGFVGVDVFFVISGYLITSIILTELNNGTFSITGFYERRARRILPLLFFVSFACVPFAYTLMLPRDLADFSKSLISVSAFVSNIFFWIQSGYFDTANELKPLLHTWSLAVEEQYYLIFPLALLIALRFGRTFTTIAVAAAAALSFGVAEWGSTHAPVATFYLLPTRVWELLIGAIIPFLPTKRPNAGVCSLLSAAGLLLIVVAVASYDQVPFPGRFALLPTCGAALIILFADPHTIPGRILASKPLVGLGLISYGAYLWHQPLFVFARLVHVREPSILAYALLTVAALGLAWASWHFIEKPFRNRTKFNKARIAQLGAVGATCLALFGFAGALQPSMTTQLQAHALSPEDRAIYDLLVRHTSGNMYEEMGDNGLCNFWSKSVTEEFVQRFKGCAAKHGKAVIVLGDSHAMSIYNALHRSQINSFLVGVSQGGCRPQEPRQRCHYAGFDTFLASHKESVRVILFHQSGSYLLRDYKGRRDSTETFDPGRRYTIDYESISKAADYLDTITDKSDVVWLGPFVEARVNLRDLRRLSDDGFYINPKSLDAFGLLEKEIEAQIGGNRRFAFMPLGSILNITSDFLLVGDCLTYRDPDHFSLCGERIVGDRLKPHLKRLLQETPPRS